MSSPLQIVVAGDVCLDVLGYPIPGSPGDGATPKENWRHTGETRTFYRHGGAWLLEDLVRAALKKGGLDCKIGMPTRPKDIEKLTRFEVVHSLLSLQVFTDKLENEKKCKCEVKCIRVAKSHGFSGPDNGETATLNVSMQDDSSVADLVILDDTGNRFRHQNQLWPAAIRSPAAEKKPLVLYKLHRPLPASNVKYSNELWSRVCAAHACNMIVIVSIDDLRESGAVISRRLSWERTALDLVWQLNGGAGSDRLAELRQCRHLIIRIGLEGIVYWNNPGDDQVPRAWLLYKPDEIEGDWDDHHAGTMVGFGSAFFAEFAATLLSPQASDEFQKLRSGSMPAIDQPSEPHTSFPDGFRQFECALKNGLLASRRWLTKGYGEPPSEHEAPNPEYPIDKLESFSDEDRDTISSICIPISFDLMNSDSGRWAILNTQLRGSDIDAAAEAIVVMKKPTRDRQVGRLLKSIPIGVFGKLTTFDRNEIEGYRAISNVVREYLGQASPKRPLCVAVFGPPGSGKSFGVEQVALSIGSRTGAKICKLTFNLSQLRGVDELNRSLHLVRDAVLKGDVPLVFFDEFDSKADGNLFWLKLLLAPMQDGEFLDQGASHPIGRSIFVFAGGTANSFAEFVPDPKPNPNQLDAVERAREFREVKGPDFISRLRGVVNILGVEIDPALPRAPVALRRAGILRFQLQEKARHLFDSDDRLQIDEGVLRAFLNVRRFHHGIRSMEAVLDMSQLGERRRFDAGSLPHPSQLALHVDPLALEGRAADTGFLYLVHREMPFPHDRRELIAKEIHVHYVEERTARHEYKPDKLSHQEWDHLNAFYKDSNRAQADDIARKLRMIGLRYADASSVPGGQITELQVQDIDKFAKPEHDRWLAERRAQGWKYGEKEDPAQKTHPAMKEWNDLPEEQREKDRSAIRAIPRYLKAANYVVVK